MIVASLLSAISGPASALDGERGPEVAVGAELQATTDVTLHRAEIAKGSRVNVTRIVQRDGHVDAIDVALADGHVVKLSLAMVRAAFRIVGD